MPDGWLLAVGIRKPVTVPVWVTVPILPVVWSTNHTLPSGPTVISVGPLLAVGMLNSTTVLVAAEAEPAATVATPSAASTRARRPRAKFCVFTIAPVFGIRTSPPFYPCPATRRNPRFEKDSSIVGASAAYPGGGLVTFRNGVTLDW